MPAKRNGAGEVEVPVDGLASQDLSRRWRARRIRELGTERVLYGSDAAVSGNTPREGWAAFQRLPVSAAELGMIAGNVAPYMQ